MPAGRCWGFALYYFKLTEYSFILALSGLTASAVGQLMASNTIIPIITIYQPLL